MSVGWENANDGPIWVPVLHAAELKAGIPLNLLARIAFEESSFLPEVISGHELSSANCIGIMQLNPVYFPDAGKNPAADIDTATGLLVSLYRRFSDWQVALAAYNWGGGNEHHAWVSDGDTYKITDCPAETQRYVRDIIADVPVPGALIALSTDKLPTDKLPTEVS